MVIDSLASPETWVLSYPTLVRSVHNALDVALLVSPLVPAAVATGACWPAGRPVLAGGGRDGVIPLDAPPATEDSGSGERAAGRLARLVGGQPDLDERLPEDLRGRELVVFVPADRLLRAFEPGQTGPCGVLVDGNHRKPKSGEEMVALRVIGVFPTTVNRRGKLTIDGRPADYARLGGLESVLATTIGDSDLIDTLAGEVDIAGNYHTTLAAQRAADAARPATPAGGQDPAGGSVVALEETRVLEPSRRGKLPAGLRGGSTRVVTRGLALRAVLLMTLMPEANAEEVWAALFGELARLPWRVPSHLPSSTVLSTWRAALGDAVVIRLRDRLLEAAAALHAERPDLWLAIGAPTGPGSSTASPGPVSETRAGTGPAGGDRALEAVAVDGMVTRMPDTAASRAAFGAANRTGPFPQQRSLIFGAVLTRTILALVTGPSAGSGKAVGEQALLRRALTECPWVFTKRRILILDRNFPGLRLLADIAQHAHFLIRVKDGITTEQIGEALPDGSYHAWLGTGPNRIKVRVVRYAVTLEGRETPEEFRLATSVLDPAVADFDALTRYYQYRWVGSETTNRELKSTMHGAGPAVGACHRSRTPTLVRQEAAAWVVTHTLLRLLAIDAADLATPATKGRRAGQPVEPREISHTAIRRAVVAATRSSDQTAVLPASLALARHHRLVLALGQARFTVDRHRHRPRQQKSHSSFKAAPPRLPTITARAKIIPVGPPAAAAAA